MENTIAILRVLARVLSIASVTLMVARLQYSHDIEEAGHPRKEAIIVFTLWGALCSWVSSYGNWLATFFAIVFSAAASAFIFRGRADNLAVVVIGALMLHLASPVFSGRPIIWDGWITLLAINAIAGLILMGVYAYKEESENLTEGEADEATPETEESSSNPYDDSRRTPIMYATVVVAALAVASVTTLSILAAY